MKGKDKAEDEKLKPSDEDMRDAICAILKEVDFNTVRFDYCSSLFCCLYRFPYFFSSLVGSETL